MHLEGIERSRCADTDLNRVSLTETSRADGHRAGLPRFLHRSTDAVGHVLQSVPHGVIQCADGDEGVTTRLDPGARTRIERMLPAAVEILRGLVDTSSFARWIVPLLARLAARVATRDAAGGIRGGADLVVTFPHGGRGYSLRLVLDERADPKVDGYFETEEGSTSGLIGLNVRRLLDATPDDLAHALYHEFIHLFSSWFRHTAVGAARLPRVSPAVRSALELRKYEAEIRAIDSRIRTLIMEIRPHRRSRGAPPFTGDSGTLARTLVEEAVVRAETDFMMMTAINAAGSRGLGETTTELDDRRAIEVGEGAASYLFDTGLIFEERDKTVLTTSENARNAEHEIKRILGGVSWDYLTLRAGSERALRARP